MHSDGSLASQQHVTYRRRHKSSTSRPVSNYDSFDLIFTICEIDTLKKLLLLNMLQIVMLNNYINTFQQ